MRQQGSGMSLQAAQSRIAAELTSVRTPCRCGVLPFVFDEDFGFARYAEYALDVPMYFVYR